MAPVLVNTLDILTAFLDLLKGCEGLPPCLYVDLEGNNLSRHGTISLMTIYFEPAKTVYLINITELKESAFSTSGAELGLTLRDVLQSKDFVKVFFDIRNDSDALFSLYGIRVAGIEDLQLMELAARKGSKRLLNGLAKCIEHDSGLDWSERRTWQAVKDRGKRLFAPERGGSYTVFDQRPLPPEMVEYCCQDVFLMPQLREAYRKELCDAWWEKIETETAARILASQGAHFNGKGRHMSLSPPGWIHWQPNPTQWRSRELTSREAARRCMSKVSQKEPRIEKSRTEEPKTEEPTTTEHQDSVGDEDASRCLALDDLSGALNALSCGEHSSDVDSTYNESSRRSSFESYTASKDFSACDAECGYCGSCILEQQDQW